jgi:hypothetical protein
MCPQMLVKLGSIVFHENRFGGSRFVTLGKADTCMAKMIGNFVTKTPKANFQNVCRPASHHSSVLSLFSFFGRLFFRTRLQIKS